ncbi:hypothetical protein [Flexivirga oryzae]|uniref:Uncharacterized protein n=1 Tax=Flexivirga oryzae TaxID=1794944 RepID=A0A839N4B2_9MICO|nr:hypothetical protein [Flexivirga oryzae]MBB2891599.1 hypothetical protein [Flexivirga oryzae]
MTPGRLRIGAGETVDLYDGTGRHRAHIPYDSIDGWHTSAEKYLPLLQSDRFTVDLEPGGQLKGWRPNYGSLKRSSYDYRLEVDGRVYDVALPDGERLDGAPLATLTKAAGPPYSVQTARPPDELDELVLVVAQRGLSAYSAGVIANITNL